MDKNGLYGIYDLWHKPFWQTKAFYLVLGMIGTILLLLSIWYFIRRCRRKKYIKTAWDSALLELEILGTTELVTVEQCKAFYFRLTWILKKYLHERYDFDLFGRTDDEVINYLEKINFSHDLLQDIRDIFAQGLMPKFAQVDVMHDQIKQDLNRSIAIIQKTIPQLHNKQ